MIYFLCCLGFVLVYFCYKRKRHLETEGKDKDLSYAFVTNSFEVLLPFTVVTLLYAILSFTLSDMGSDQVTLETLRIYEKRIQEIQEWLKYFKLNSVYSFLLIGVWFLVSLIVRYKWGQGHSERMEKVYSKYETYHKWIKRIAVVVTLLATFTFFGSQVDGLGGELEAHIKTMKDNYNAYVAKLERAIKETVATETHSRITSSAPAQYARAIRINRQTWERFSSVAGKYRSTSVRYEYTSPKFEALESRIQRQEKSVVESIAVIEKTIDIPQSSSPEIESLAKTITNNRLKQINESLDRYLTSLAAQAEPVLKTPLGKKIIPGALGVLISHNNISVLKSLAEQSPILDAILPVFTKTLSKKVEMQTNEAIHRLAEKVVTQPHIKLEREMKGETETIVKDVVIEWNESSNQTLLALETAVKRAEIEVSEASEEVGFRYEASRAKLVRQNNSLMAEVETRLSARQEASPKLIDRVKGIDDPATQNKELLIPSDFVVGGKPV